MKGGGGVNGGKCILKYDVSFMISREEGHESVIIEAHLIPSYNHRIHLCRSRRLIYQAGNEIDGAQVL